MAADGALGDRWGVAAVADPRAWEVRVAAGMRRRSRAVVAGAGAAAVVTARAERSGVGDGVGRLIGASAVAAGVQLFGPAGLAEGLSIDAVGHRAVQLAARAWWSAIRIRATARGAEHAVVFAGGGYRQGSASPARGSPGGVVAGQAPASPARCAVAQATLFATSCALWRGDHFGRKRRDLVEYPV